MAAKRAPETLLVPTIDFSAFQSVIAQQAASWCQAQSVLLQAWQAAADAWFEHCRQEIAAAGDALGDLCDCRDLGAMVEIQQRFLAGAFERIAGDAQIVADTTVSASRQSAELMSGNGAALLFTDQPVWRTDRAQRGAAPDRPAQRTAERLVTIKAG